MAKIRMKINEPCTPADGRKGWIRRSGEEIRFPADFGMFELRNHNNSVRLTALCLAIVALALAGCMNVGGKGIALDRQRLERAESGSLSDPQSPIGNADVQVETEEFHTMEASPSDPYGLMPVGWPEDVPMHPDALLVYSGEFGVGGLYLVTIVPTDLATPLGAQTFHLESLAGWESIQVNEERSEGGKESGALVIVAERRNAWLRVVSERAVPGFINALPNNEQLLETVGREPIIIRLYYAAIPEEN